MTDFGRPRLPFLAQSQRANIKRFQRIIWINTCRTMPNFKWKLSGLSSARLSRAGVLTTNFVVVSVCGHQLLLVAALTIFS